MKSRNQMEREIENLPYRRERTRKAYKKIIGEHNQTIDKLKAQLAIAREALEEMVDPNIDSGIVFDIAFHTLARIDVKPVAVMPRHCIEDPEDGWISCTSHCATNKGTLIVWPKDK